MRISIRIKCCFIALVAMAFAITVVAQQSKRVDDKVLSALPNNGDDWLTNGRDYGETRYSPLTQINAGNIGRLGLAWYYDVNVEPGSLEATPIEWNGTVYASGTWSVIFALDARTGKLKWRYDPHFNHQSFPPGSDGRPDSSKGPRTGPTMCCGPDNRGLAVYDNKVYAGMLDGRLIAFDAETGKIVWQVQTTEPNADYSVTSAPRILGNKVFIGNAGSDYAIRGYVTAYDAETGKQLWRFYTVPGDPSKPFESKAMQMAAKTWSGNAWYIPGNTNVGGGGSNWDGVAYDPDLDLVYFGTGNACPYPVKWRSPKGGNSLFTTSIVAVHASTGEYAWHYQTTPGDEWDYDAVQGLILTDLKISGQTRKVLMQANKNGYYFVLDRKTGKFISAAPLAKINWSTGIDPKTGVPIVAPGARYDDAEDGVWISPGGYGVHNWHAMSYNPNTGLTYVPAGNSWEWYAYDPNWKYKLGLVNFGQLRVPAPYLRMLPQIEPKAGVPAYTKLSPDESNFLIAWDPVAQKERWRIPRMNGGGTVTTAGNLVFAASADGRLVALSADKGGELWGVKLATGFSNPSIYMLDGKQYVVVLDGSSNGRVYAFVLDGSMPIPATSAAPTQRAAGGKTTLDGVYTAGQAARGQAAYAQYCASCHGSDLSGGQGPGLAGEQFASNWSGHTADDLFNIISTTMPLEGAGSLSPENYADIVAYMLQVNRFPAGSTELKGDLAGLKTITITAPRVPGAANPR